MQVASLISQHQLQFFSLPLIKLELNIFIELNNYFRSYFVPISMKHSK